MQFPDRNSRSVQQLESCIVGCTQCFLDFVFVADCLKFARSHHKVVPHAAHVIIIQDITEDFKVLGLVHSGVFTYLAEIRECTPLSRLMRNVRLLHGIDLGAVVGHAFRLRACPAKSACTGFHMILIVGLPLPAASYGSSCIYMAGVGRFPVINEFAYPRYPTARRLIAAGLACSKRRNCRILWTERWFRPSDICQSAARCPVSDRD